ncbi:MULTISPECIES: hypothetical protein [Marinobacter]|jgi:hypothetical protein|uniref:hypothetical protein n=1 Tax=Marinobacter TaxID=2742 RepID=UPI0000F36140|nr:MULTISPECIES: hypothetical protein [Marinobacter]EAZ97105.1 hypothetical protein MELB17_10923 [Marinobacter sp. ELB17]EAZ97395.1 hypothetical protein MELB17_10843 [Marinobacter sp. ELB17]EBA00626.1 hypothetical protein MELB17_22355 [Marinobacter sp. ELB17]EBA01367.1 hypothetical protein MELB17_01275 [Marinobacter sp. ELB17]PFG08806.1 hypothetical protein ATI45_1132 [Marinobacter sp. LV10MA510-1]
MKVLKITTHWTTEEAACVHEALDTLQTAIWESYGKDITGMYRHIANEQKEKSEQSNAGMDF